MIGNWISQVFKILHLLRDESNVPTVRPNPVRSVWDTGGNSQRPPNGRPTVREEEGGPGTDRTPLLRKRRHERVPVSSKGKTTSMTNLMTDDVRFT